MASTICIGRVVIINKLILGDCLEKMKDISDKSIDMILTDLPYGITNNYWDSIINLEFMWNIFRRVLKESGVIALTASQPFTSMLVMSNKKMFKHEWIWQKNKAGNFLNTVREPFKEHESVLIFGDKKWTYNPQLQKRADSGYARMKTPLKSCTTPSSNYSVLESRIVELKKERLPSSVQKHNIVVGLHPNQKPVTLFEYLIKTYTNENDLVLDCCAGSGTTAIACINTNRNYICIEKDEKYFEIMKKRVSDHNKQTRLIS